MKRLQFCIIGCGISGMVSAKNINEKGYEFILLEKSDDIGGVWHNKSYEGVRIQTGKKSYEFADFPHSNFTNEHPDRMQLMNYYRQYCHHFDIYKYFNFNCDVISTTFFNNIWNVVYIKNGIKHYIHCDHLIIASGIYTKPNIPPNMVEIHKKSNKVIHSMELKNFDNIKDNKIFVIGNGPTGCDIAVSSYKKNAENVTILYRSKRWIFRRYIWNTFSTGHLNRLSFKIAQILFEKILIFFITLIYHFCNLLHNEITFKIATPSDFVNRQNLVLNDYLTGLVKQDKISYIQSNDIEIDDKYINFNGEKKEYDLCILATGYNSEIPFFKFLNKKKNNTKVPFLYKNIIDIDLQKCGFIGFAPSFNWIQVSELQIKWYLNYVEKKINYCKEFMKKQISERKNLVEKSKSKLYDYHDLAISGFDYCDDLAKDINNKKFNKFSPFYWLKVPKSNDWD